MKNKSNIGLFRILLFLSLIICGCSSEEELVELPLDDGISDVAIENGAMNAVRKARQMTDIEFIPKNAIKLNSGSCKSGKKYQGMIYSLVSETENFVGTNVSFHTFMSAIHNPKSKLYTVDVSQPPYHGKMRRAYYGTVCSGLVSYALGIFPAFYTRDFRESNLMKEIDYTNPDNLHIADVLWKKGHVGIITDIVKDNNGHVSTIEISESVVPICKRYKKTREQFLNMMTSHFTTVLRYTELYKNTDYVSVPEFVAVLDEIPVQPQYNDDLCVDKGDKSCYLEEEEVIVNVMHSYEYIEIYRDNELYKTIDTKIEDVKLTNLPYGDYKARIYSNGQYSDYTYWKTVNANVKADRANGRLHISSANAVPCYVRARAISGLLDPTPTQKYGFHIISKDEISKGFMDIEKLNLLEEYPYIFVCFSTEYGTIDSRPINWNE